MSGRSMMLVQFYRNIRFAYKEHIIFSIYIRPLVKLVLWGASVTETCTACTASDLQGLNFESCVWRAVSSQPSHHTQEVLLAQFSLYGHRSGLKPDSFHFYFNLSLCFLSCFAHTISAYLRLNL